MTHAELVERAVKWLRNTKRCQIVLSEIVTSSPETPDAIGWVHGGLWSYLVECKTSVNDFYSDSKKQGRSLIRMAGLGRERYYLTEKGTFNASLVSRFNQLRPGWGLLEICGKQTKVRIRAIPNDHMVMFKELPVLYSYARRLQEGWIARLQKKGVLKP